LRSPRAACCCSCAANEKTARRVRPYGNATIPPSL
jgi:hypothetical protein